MERILAVYDVEAQYAARFAEVSNQNESIPFTVMAFTSFDKLRDYILKHPVEILLIGDGVAKESVELLPVEKIMLLREGESIAIKDEYPGIYKYQPSDAIIRDVMACYGADSEVADFGRVRNCRVIGIYSPVSRCLKTSLALTMGQLMALESRVLYINLESFSGFHQLTGEEYSKTLSDVLYFYKQGDGNGIRLQSAVYHLGQMDYIPPVQYPDDLNQADAEEMASVLQKVAKEGGYDVLIIDIGNYGRNAEEILKICDVVYMPVKEDGISVCKIEEWEEFLRLSGNQRILERVIRVKLPFHSSFGRKENYIEQLLWGELGDYVRQLLKGRGRERIL